MLDVDIIKDLLNDAVSHTSYNGRYFIDVSRYDGDQIWILIKATVPNNLIVCVGILYTDGNRIWSPDKTLDFDLYEMNDTNTIGRQLAKVIKNYIKYGNELFS